ncbi:hypothetical protein DM02DRAFT_658330 [Periconia macrospinosa]|uniref:C3H1-type domain-containing protein n=1 Tax=Periconia macrospinosa TaxID=97972 RepID=A0A2V1DGX3_9PLEO|nr:hypothetical protein DM02DRAFT_658330 [Periconia macrospinosa]
MPPPDAQPRAELSAKNADRNTFQPSGDASANYPPKPVDGDDVGELPTKDHKEPWVRAWWNEQAALTALDAVCLRDMLGHVYSEHSCKRDKSCHAVFHICRGWLRRKGEELCTEVHPIHIDEEKKLVAHIPSICTPFLKTGACHRPEGQCPYAHIGADSVQRRMDERNASKKTAGGA